MSRIPKKVLERHYKIRLPPRDSSKYTTTTFLSTFALQKGWITGGSSNPNIAEAAKVVIKDYTTGVLVFCHVRPDFNSEKHKAVTQSGFDIALETSVIPEEEFEEESATTAPTTEVILDKAMPIDDGAK